MKPRLLVFVLLGLTVFAGRLSAAETPPRTLHLVGDHWTAWDPPAEHPPGAEVYTIVRGDTLWDLAARNFGDPYLWPQIWEQNRYILDAHWIYPGDPLVLGLEVVTPEMAPGGPLEGPGAGAGTAGEAGGPRSPYLDALDAAGVPGPLGIESDIYCTGYIGGLDESFPFRMIGSEYQALSPSIQYERDASYIGLYGSDTVKVGLDLGDIVYTDGGREGGLVPGQLFTVVRGEEKVRHPVTREVVGRFYRYLGRLRVLSVQETGAIAEVVHACDPIPVGSALLPFEPEPVPLGRRTTPRPANLPTTAERLRDAPVIVRSEDNLVSLGEDNVVYIDRGVDDDLVPGDVFTIYRLHGKGLPPVVLGELAVLSVRDRSAVARILRSRYTIYVGDRLDPK